MYCRRWAATSSGSGRLSAGGVTERAQPGFDGFNTGFGCLAGVLRFSADSAQRSAIFLNLVGTNAGGLRDPVGFVQDPSPLGD